MCTILCLCIHSRIPITIIKYNRSAPVKLIPNPPLLVLNIKQNILESLLNLSTKYCLVSTLVLPSNLKYVNPCKFKNDSNIFNILLICVNINTRCLFCFKLRNNFANVCNLPESNCINFKSGKYDVNLEYDFEYGNKHFSNIFINFGLLL